MEKDSAPHGPSNNIHNASIWLINMKKKYGFPFHVEFPWCHPIVVWIHCIFFSPGNRWLYRWPGHVYRAPCVVYFVFVQNCLKHKANVVTQQKRSLYNDKVIAWPLFCLAAEALFHNAQVHWKLGTPTSDRTAQVGARKLLWRETERRQREREKYI